MTERMLTVNATGDLQDTYTTSDPSLYTTGLVTLVRKIIVCNMTFNLQPGEYILHNKEPRTILATLVLIVFLLGTAGNLIVIIAVIVSRRLQTTTNIFVVNLAVSDFVTALFLPAHVATLLSTNSCYIPDLFCKFVAAVTLTTLGCSIVTLALIAFTRFNVIYEVLNPKPFLKNMYRRRNIVAMVAFSWLYPIVLMCIIVPAGVGSLGYSLQYKVCSQNTNNEYSDYLSLTAGLLVQFPAFVVIILSYTFILRMIRQHHEVMNSLQAPKRGAEKDFETHTNVTIIEDEVDGVPGNATMTAAESIKPDNHAPADPDDTRSRNPSSAAGVINGASEQSNTLPQESNISRSPTLEDIHKRKRKERYNQQLKITLNLFIVVCAYTICVLPLGVAVMIPPSDPVIPWLTVLLLCNSCLNPIIYALKHPTFSKVFLCLLRCRYADIPEPSAFLRARIYDVTD
ncbi:probable G-protein coupled receptor No18 [Diadema antillarum]|uniref:probable G-protein coupled receptor No18 n=1 Tax=Diadema antillarum TaxID=105358 RepID=UPI003A8583F9